ncbi:hypothetical protein Bbelb_277220 [Branchiostoma belcheri]|nr:hypothetical protein Bbelb_277220 [Branchiostoma belcheri]
MLTSAQQYDATQIRKCSETRVCRSLLGVDSAAVAGTIYGILAGETAANIGIKRSTAGPADNRNQRDLAPQNKRPRRTQGGGLLGHNRKRSPPAPGQLRKERGGWDDTGLDQNQTGKLKVVCGGHEAEVRTGDIREEEKHRTDLLWLVEGMRQKLEHKTPEKRKTAGLTFCP